MSDLKSQLASAFGREVPADPRKALSDPARPEPLADDAHLGGEWHRRLSELARPWQQIKLADRPKLGQARQASDQLVKLLKKSGRGRDAKELAKLRDAFMARRDKAAWAVIKDRLGALDVSDKAYRSLKQSKEDPVRLIERIDRAGETLRGASPKRLRSLLT